MDNYEINIENEYSLLADFVILKACDGKESEVKCRKCRMNMLLCNDSDLLDRFFNTIEYTAEEILDVFNESEDAELYKLLTTHISSISAREFYKEILPDIEEKFSRIISSVADYSRECCKEKENYEQLHRYAVSEIYNAFPVSDVLSLASYYLYNQRYEKEWYEITTFSLPIIINACDSNNHSMFMMINEQHKYNQILMGKVIAERYDFFYCKEVNYNHFRYFKNIANSTIDFYYNDKNFSKYFVTDSVNNKKSDNNPDRYFSRKEAITIFSGIIDDYYNNAKIEKNDFNRIIADNFAYIISTSNRAKRQEAFLRKYSKNKEALNIFKLKDEIKASYARHQIYFYISAPVKNLKEYSRQNLVEQFNERSNHNLVADEIYSLIKNLFYTRWDESFTQPWVNKKYNRDLQNIFYNTMCYNRQLYIPGKLGIVSEDVAQDSLIKQYLNIPKDHRVEQIIESGRKKLDEIEAEIDEECFVIKEIESFNSNTFRFNAFRSLFCKLIVLMIMVYPESAFEKVFKRARNVEYAYSILYYYLS